MLARQLARGADSAAIGRFLEERAQDRKLTIGLTDTMARAFTGRPAFCAIHSAIASVGIVRVSRTSTPRDASSLYPSFSNSSFSTRALARNGPDPIAKYPSGFTAQPAPSVGRADRRRRVRGP